MQLDRPIAFTLEDLEEYKDSRGFVFDNIQNWLPGYKITNIDDLKTFIYEIADDLDSSSDIRHELFSKMHRYNDNKSSKRICDYFGIK
jgi:CDP-glycerol glycerophosphotransferase (TagB/SpsB family)